MELEGDAAGLAGLLLEGDDVVARLHVGDALTNRLDDTSTLVSQDDGECTLGILARQSVGIWGSMSVTMDVTEAAKGARTGVADTSVVDLDADLVGPRRANLDVLEAKLLAGLPGDGGLASNGLPDGSDVSKSLPRSLCIGRGRTRSRWRGKLETSTQRNATHLAYGRSHCVEQNWDGIRV